VAPTTTPPTIPHQPTHTNQPTDQPTYVNTHTQHTHTHTHTHTTHTGKAIAEAIRGEIKQDVEALKAKTGVTPGLAVVLVGNRTDSATYVRMKIKACEEVCAS
jgi:hypothetical protein